MFPYSLCCAIFGVPYTYVPFLCLSVSLSGIQVLGSWARYLGKGTQVPRLTTSSPGSLAIGSWAGYRGLGTQVPRLTTSSAGSQAIGSWASTEA